MLTEGAKKQQSTHRRSADRVFRRRGAAAKWIIETGEPRDVPRGKAVLEGRIPCNYIYVLLDGWAIRTHSGPGGHMQTTSIYLPGDLMNLGALTEPVTQQPVMALTNVSTVRVSSRRLFEKLATERALLLDILGNMTMETDFLAEALVALGEQKGRERLGTLLYQTWRRLIAAGLVEPSDNRFPMPLTQEQLGHSLGITNVHANRVVGELRNDGIVRLAQGHCEILDRERFEAFSVAALD